MCHKSKCLECIPLIPATDNKKKKEKTFPVFLLAVVTDKLSCEKQAGGRASDTADPLGQNRVDSKREKQR